MKITADFNSVDYEELRSALSGELGLKRDLLCRAALCYHKDRAKKQRSVFLARCLASGKTALKS